MQTNDDGPRAEPTSGGIRRRDLIRRAAIAGTLAWTAPVVVESLASPASALTVDCLRLHIVVSDPGLLSCGTMPASLSAWTDSCNGSFSASTLTSQCGVGLTSIPVATGTLASFGITRTSCVAFGSTLRMTRTDCSFVDGALDAAIGGCRGETSINNGTPGNRTISFDRGNTVSDYWLVIRCS